MKPPSRLLVTGAAGYIGSRVVRALAQAPWVEEVVALDLRPLPFSHPKVRAYRRDATGPLDDLFRAHRPQAVLPLAFLLRPLRDREAARRVDLGSLQRALEASAATGVRQVLYLGSSTVYGAHPDNPVPLTEEAPLRPNPGFAYAEDKVAAEALLRDFRRDNPGVGVVVLRACVVMGPRARNFITSALSKPVLPAFRGHDPPMQFVHEDDIVALLLHCLREGVEGTYNVAGRGTVPWSALARLAGRPLVPLPAPLLYGLTEATWRLRLQGDSPAVGLEFIRWPWVVDTTRLEREAGFVPRHTSEGALRSFLASR